MYRDVGVVFFIFMGGAIAGRNMQLQSTLVHRGTIVNQQHNQHSIYCLVAAIQQTQLYVWEASEGLCLWEDWDLHREKDEPPMCYTMWYNSIVVCHISVRSVLWPTVELAMTGTAAKRQLDILNWGEKKKVKKIMVQYIYWDDKTRTSKRGWWPACIFFHFHRP